MKEEDTDTKTFSSVLLQKHDLWDEKAFGMTYKK
ncbi:unknown [Bacteroides sp. CAG:462]|nr:unknown [Bacteroides sp. CAG:462]